MFIEHEHTYLRYTLLAVVVLVTVLFTIPAALDGSWTVGGENCSLSDMGRSTNGASALVFNTACILAGVFMAVIGMMKIRLEKGSDSVVGLFLVLSSVFLALVGVFHLDSQHGLHMFVASTFALLVLIAGIINLVKDIDERRWIFVVPMLIQAALIAIAVIKTVISWDNFPLWEVISLAVGESWAVLVAIRHRVVYEGKPCRTFLATDDA